MPAIDLTECSSLLGRAYANDLQEQLPDRLKSTAEEVLGRIGFGKDASSDWPSRFSPMVLHYPVLQATAYEEVPRERAGEANLAHLYLLIFSVLDDRRNDGQVEMSDAEVELTGWLVQRALAILGRFTHDRQLEELSDFVCREYEKGHVRRSLLAVDDAAGTRREVDSVVVGRSYWGVLSTRALLVSAGCGKKALSEATEAFEPLVMGLQWADDMTDWEEDLDSGDDNLLLLALREDGADPYAYPATDLYKAHVGSMLLEKNVFGCAEDQANRWFTDAMNRQQRLGCAELAGLIGARRAGLSTLRHEIEMQAELDALAQLSVLQVDRRRRGPVPPAPG